MFYSKNKFEKLVNLVGFIIRKFLANNLVLNLDKGNRVMFKVTNAPHCACKTGYEAKCIQET